MSEKELPDWEDVLSSAARLQQIVPGTVLVGGTAAATFAKHRLSRDADHVHTHLREHFDNVLADLESIAGWKTARLNRPVQILGSLDGIETGIRQLIRKEPLETTTLLHQGQQITLPTAEEMLRIKAALILKRNATRDYLDFVALADHLGESARTDAFRRFDELYPNTAGESPLHQLQIQLSNPLPFDLEETHLKEYKHLAPRWHDWVAVVKVCRDIAISLFDRLADDKSK
jgi:hypothetical protein